MQEREHTTITFSRVAVGTFHRFVVIAGAVLLTLAFFLVLPLMQTIAKAGDDRMSITPLGRDFVPPPPPPDEPEPEDEEEEEEPEPEPPPELQQEMPQIDLSQIESMMSGVGGSGWGHLADFSTQIKTVVGDKDEVEEMFSMSELDQKPRVLNRVRPTLSPAMRRLPGGTVYVIFMVDENGRVLNPKIQDSPNPLYDKAALAAIKQWRFEPGKRNGKAVKFRVRQPMTFPSGR